MLINRKSMIQISILFCLLVSMLMLSEQKPTYACDCAIPGSFTERLENHDVVFEGVVIESSKDKRTPLGRKVKINSSEKIEWTFQVNGAWKGEVTEEITVVSKLHSASCGYEFEVGKRFAVFATSNINNITVSSCSGTTSIADNSKIFEELGDYSVTLTTVTNKVESPPAEGTSQIDSSGTKRTTQIVLIVVILFVVAALLIYRNIRK